MRVSQAKGTAQALRWDIALCSRNREVASVEQSESGREEGGEFQGRKA